MIRLIDQFSKTGDISFFGDSQTAKTKEYLAAEQDVRRLHAELVATYGEGINDLLDDYNDALGTLEEFIYEYYFEQGFIVARR